MSFRFNINKWGLASKNKGPRGTKRGQNLFQISQERKQMFKHSLNKMCSEFLNLIFNIKKRHGPSNKGIRGV